MKVLLVDDDHDYVEALQTYLATNRYETLAAFSCKQAEQVLRDSNKEIGVALVDLWMETKAAGVELIERIGAAYPCIVSVAITGYGREYLDRCMEAGAFSFLEKRKTKPEDILPTIRRAEDHWRRLVAYGPELPILVEKLVKMLQDAQTLATELQRTLRRPVARRQPTTPEAQDHGR